MRSLYGTRSIIPNNYYFTFDRIYKEHPTKYNNDNVLIGRAVLYEPDSSVFLKTSEGYIKVAQLDNTGRLIRNEGYVLDALKGDVNINELSGDSYTYNGDGVYIVNFNDLYNDNTYMQLKNLDDYSFSQVYYYYDETEKKYKEGICEANYMKKTNLFYLTTLKNETVLAPLYTINSFSSWNLGTTDKKFDNKLFEIKENASPKGYFLQFERSLLTDNILPNYYYIEHNSSNEYYKKISKEEVKKYLELKTEVFYLKENSEISQLNNDNDYYVEDNSGKHILEKIIRTTDGIDVPSFREKTDKDIGIRQSYSKIDNKEQYCYVSRTEISPFTSTSKIEENIEDYYIKINIFLENTEGVLLTSAENLNNQQKNEKDLYYKFYADSENPQTSIKIMNQARFKLDIHIGYYFNSINDKNPSENWPSVRGIPKEEYLKDSVFLLEQRSNSPKQDAKKTMYQIDQNSVTSSMSNLYAYQTKTESNGITQITNNVIREPFINDPVNWSLATSANVSVGQKAIIEMEVYQILTDISYLKDYNSSAEILKKDPDKDRINLNHLNKTFIRKGKRTFYLSEYYNSLPPSENKPNITSTVRYIFDEDSGNGFMSVSSETEESSEVNLYRCKTDWGKWEDVTEQYTGYIGDLDPNTVGFMSPEDKYVYAQLPYNKHTQYYTDDQGENIATIDQVTFDNSCDSNGTSSKYYVKANANRGNLNDSNTLVEATNTLDEIIGSRTRLNNIEKEGQVNKIVQGDLSSSLNDDNRPYKIPEKDIMDALVHHDADIGAIENLSNADIKDENGNTIVSNNTYNLTFTKQNEPDKNINSSNNSTVKVRSLTDAIVKTDNIIGHVERIGKDGSVNKQLHSKKKITGTGSGQDERYYNIEEQNLIDAIVHHDADIGCIEKINTLSKQQNHLGTHNLNFVSTGDYTYLDNENNQISDINSLTEAIVKLDNMVGYLGRLNANNKNGDCVNTNSGTQGITGTGNTKEDDIENNQIFSDARPYNIPETTVIDTLVHHDADIGAIEDLKARQGSDNNTNNLNFTTAKDPTDTDKLKGVNDIQSIKDALIILDNLIGARRRLSDTTLATNDTTLINSNADSNDKRPVNIPENNIIDSIIHHDADIGEIEKLNTTNTSERTMNNNNLIYSSSATNQKIRKENDEWKVAEIRSLTDAIEALDKIIGPITGFNGKTISGMASDLDNIIDYPYDLNDTRSINIPDNNIIYAIGHHDADIGAIENISQKNTNNLNFVNNGSFSNLNNKNNQTSNINSLTEAIIKEDNMIGYIGRLGQSKKNVSETDGTQGVTGTGGATDPDIRPYSIPETTVIDTLVHHDADIGFIEKLNGNNIEFTQKEKDENNKHEIHSLTDAITILDNIIGNYDKIEQLKGSNLEEKNADLVTAINHLSEFIIGYKSDLENKNNLIEEEKRATLVAAINALNTVLGKFNIENTNNLKDTENIKTFIQAIKVLDTKIGSVGENPSLQDQIDEINGTMLDVTNMMKYINNLGLNLDILTHTVNNISNNIALEWETF